MLIISGGFFLVLWLICWGERRYALYLAWNSGMVLFKCLVMYLVNSEVKYGSSPILSTKSLSPISNSVSIFWNKSWDHSFVSDCVWFVLTIMVRCCPVAWKELHKTMSYLGNQAKPFILKRTTVWCHCYCYHPIELSLLLFTIAVQSIMHCQVNDNDFICLKSYFIVKLQVDIQNIFMFQ